MVADGLKEKGRVLIDPNSWSKDSATALADWAPSEDGSKLLYSIQDGGSDWRTVKVMDVESGEILADTIEWVKFSSIEWLPDNSGFLYSRFPEPEKGEAFQSLNKNHAVYYHELGTDQEEDQLLYATPNEPDLNHSVQLSDNQNFALVYSSSGTDNRYRVVMLDFNTENADAREIVPNFDNSWGMFAATDKDIYFVTNKDAPKNRIVKMPRNGTEADIVEIIPEGDSVIEGASIVGGQLLVVTMEDAKNVVTRYTLDGTADGQIDLPGIGSAGGFSSKVKGSETFYSFSSFNRPTTIYRYDAASKSSQIWAEPDISFNPDDYSVEQRFYNSKDGTKVPMFIIRRADSTGPEPTILYGYGGFNISITPGFNPLRMSWIDNGGTYVIANLRGGGEYGKKWHDDGRLLNKQNVFDDFIAAGEFLKKEGITGKDQLAIEGRSNGGLLIGAVTNQRPDLFAAAHAAVGVMDMLRFDQFTAGRYWVDDYGYPNKEEDFKNLLTYSPYHTIKNTAYPAVIVSTADTDDRVVPGHSFKYISALQHADAGDKPHIIRIETRAGHGSGKPTDKLIAEYADIYAFLGYYTGMTFDGE